jgi:streptogramin lyase
MARSNRLRCGSGPRRSQPVVEGLESRRLMAVTFNVYPLGTGSTATSIAEGPDKNIWFTLNPSAIGTINPTTGVVAEYPFPSPIGTPQSLVSGPAGDLWFLDGPNIDSVDPSTHAIVEYPITISGALPTQLAVGSDGNLWFGDQTNAAIGVFTVSNHTFTEFPLPIASDVPGPITDGPDGHLWFGLRKEAGTTIEAFGDINPSTHAITLTNLPSGTTGIRAITPGSDGNLWFTTSVPTSGGPFEIGSIDPLSRAVNIYLGGGRGAITSGPDGNIWYDDPFGEFDLASHVATSYSAPGTSFPGIDGITDGPDGNIWRATVGFVESAHIIPANQAAVAGYVYQDATGSGPPSPSNVAGPLDNVTVFLDLRGDGQLDPGDPVVNTDALGYYAFTGLTPGTYTVRLVPYPGNIATYPNNSTQTVTVAGGQLGSPSQLGLLPTTSLLPLTYDPSPFGTHNPDVQTAEVNGLYNLILHRAPDPTGGASAVAYLKNNGSLGQLAADLLTSAEYETGVIASYYQNYLRRTGSSAEIAAWVNLMQNGLTEEQVAADFLTSAEYSLLFPANATFVQALYGDVLGRLPAGSEVAAWVNLLDQGVTRSQVISAFINTHESDIRSVEGLYGIIFARGVESNAQSSAVAALQSGVTLVQLATGLFGSAEFTARANATVG